MDSDRDSRQSSPLSSVPDSLDAPDSPLSFLSRSPTPPASMARPCRDHPWHSPPASQQTSQSGSPTPDGMDSSIPSGKDGLPPAKRRRISKGRTKEHLDLRSGKVKPEQQPQLDRLLQVLHKSQKIVVVAGAGISVSAGIPDFRSSTGLFRTLKDDYKLKSSGKDLFDASVYKDNASTSSFHDMVMQMSRMTKDAKPTAFHHMLATIAQEERLLRLYSQNVDGIDTSLEPLKTSIPFGKQADGKWPRTVQLHGGLGKMVCSKCHDVTDLDAELFDGPEPPACPRCEEVDDIRTNHEGKRSHGIGRLRPRMVLYNEHNPDADAIGAVTRDDLRRRPDAIIVVGTTLRVPGVRRIVREMCGVIRDKRGGVAIWMNNDPPPPSKDLEDCWDIVVQGPCDAVAEQAAMRHWDAPEDFYTEVSDEAAARAAEHKVFVGIPQARVPWPELSESHAKLEPLPSAKHVNNSFLPPSPTKARGKPAEHGPTDWSPMVSRTINIMPSIEDGGDEQALSNEERDSTTTGLLTPKSQRSSPVKQNIRFAPKYQFGSTKAPDSKALKKKQSNVKYVKKATSGPAKPQGQRQARGKPGSRKKVPQPASMITNAFKQSKSMAATEKDNKHKCHPANMALAGEPMHPVSPQDLRNNATPPTKSLLISHQPSLSPPTHGENHVQSTKRDRMSVSSLID